MVCDDIFLTSLCLNNSLFCFHLWETFVGCRILTWQMHFFQDLLGFPVFSLAVFLTRNLLSPLFFPTLCIFSLLRLSRLSSSQILNNLIILCLVVVFFMFLVLGSHWVSLIHEFTAFIKFRTFLVIIYSTHFSVPPLSPLLWGLQLKIYLATWNCPAALFILKNSLLSLCFIVSIARSSSSLLFSKQCLSCH